MNENNQVITTKPDEIKKKKHSKAGIISFISAILAALFFLISLSLLIAQPLVSQNPRTSIELFLCGINHIFGIVFAMFPAILTVFFTIISILFGFVGLIQKTRKRTFGKIILLFFTIIFLIIAYFTLIFWI